MNVKLLVGDCREVMNGLEENSVDAIVCDPPYELTTARPGGRSEATRGAVMGGFMGMKWDGTGVAFDQRTWREALRVAKPGAHLLAFGGTRTYHRMVCAIEDAGWQIRDQIQWIFGSGFPKSKNLGGAWSGWGTALKPAHEPIVLARKPPIGTVAVNVLEHGTGALHIDGCRIAGYPMPANSGAGGLPRREVDEQRGPGIVAQPHALGRWPANVIHDGSDEVLAAFPDAPGQCADAKLDAEERKTQNVYGTMRRGRREEPSSDSENAGSVGFKMRPGARRLDEGSAARFFYCAKASREDRNAGCDGLDEKPLLWSSGTQNPGSFQAEGTHRAAPNNHPTVKPTELMRYLVRLVTPPGGG